MHDIAILGAGRIGRIHAANAARHPGLRLKYIVDPVAAAAESLAADTGAQVATLEAALADPSVAGVIIASSTDTHLDYSCRAVAAGKAVFCEKPIDQDLGRARSASAALAGSRLFLGFNRRFDPHFRTLKARLDSGAVGTLETVQITSHDPAPPPVSYIKVSGGIFKDMTIHDFDMARWLLGEPVTQVYAAASCLVDPAIGEAGDVDTAKILLRTGAGKLCVISNSRRSGYGYDQRIEAFGSKGMVKADNVLESTVSVWGAEGAAADRLQELLPGPLRRRLPPGNGPFRRHPVGQGDTGHHLRGWGRGAGAGRSGGAIGKDRTGGDAVTASPAQLPQGPLPPKRAFLLSVIKSDQIFHINAEDRRQLLEGNGAARLLTGLNLRQVSGIDTARLCQFPARQAAMFPPNPHRVGSGTQGLHHVPRQGFRPPLRKVDSGLLDTRNVACLVRRLQQGLIIQAGEQYGIIRNGQWLDSIHS